MIAMNADGLPKDKTLQPYLLIHHDIVKWKGPVNYSMSVHVLQPLQYFISYTQNPKRAEKEMMTMVNILF